MKKWHKNFHHSETSAESNENKHLLLRSLAFDNFYKYFFDVDRNLQYLAHNVHKISPRYLSFSWSLLLLSFDTSVNFFSTFMAVKYFRLSSSTGIVVIRGNKNFRYFSRSPFQHPTSLFSNHFIIIRIGYPKTKKKNHKILRMSWTEKQNNNKKMEEKVDSFWYYCISKTSSLEERKTIVMKKQKPGKVRMIFLLNKKISLWPSDTISDVASVYIWRTSRWMR